MDKNRKNQLIFLLVMIVLHVAALAESIIKVEGKPYIGCMAGDVLVTIAALIILKYDTDLCIMVGAYGYGVFDVAKGIIDLVYVQKGTTTTVMGIISLVAAANLFAIGILATIVRHRVRENNSLY